MKNTFKLMAVAMLAGSMLFTACKKDDETPDGVNVTFAGTEWAAASDAISAKLLPTGFVYIFANETAGHNPALCTSFLGKEKTFKATVTATEQTDSLGVYYEIPALTTFNENISELTYYKDNATTPDWWTKKCEIKVTEFDADNLNVSADIEATMFNYDAWDGEHDLSNVVEATLEVKVRNQALTR
ncbi:MAG: hypothetical protein IJ761_08020 [Bacteroidales bacterium]|nr:hypothetical protein [Bacteroidales bacterium]MBR1799820.1 hypothetical protein [Bacteroidales bacterium]